MEPNEHGKSSMSTRQFPRNNFQATKIRDNFRRAFKNYITKIGLGFANEEYKNLFINQLKKSIPKKLMDNTNVLKNLIPLILFYVMRKQ